MQTVDSLRVLTLNCWGLPDIVTKTVYRKYKDPAISKGRIWPKRTERFEAIAKKLHDYDIVCLQEVWIKEDQNLLSKICKENGLPYSHIFSSGLLGSSGLQIISRYPIKEVFFHRYRVNGKIYRLDHGDYHAGKGFGYAKVAVSDTQIVSLVVTHTIAKYNHEDDTYAADRLSQVWELIRFLQLTSRPHQPIFVVGDMNSRPNSVEYSLFTNVGKLVDAFGEYASRTNREHVVDDLSITSMDENPQRIDYVFYNKCQNWSLEKAQVVYNDKDFIYSDHFGVCATFSYQDSTTRNSDMTLVPRRKDSYSSVMNSFTTDNKPDLGMLPYEREKSLSYRKEKELLDECYQMVIKGIERAQWRKTTHFMRSIFVLMLVWLLLAFGIPIQIVVSLVVYAVFEALVALFPVENEISALREVISEIKYWI